MVVGEQSSSGEELNQKEEITRRYFDQREEFRKKIEETASREKEILKAQKKYLMDNTQKEIFDKSVTEVLEMLKDDPVYNKVLEKENVPEDVSSAKGTTSNAQYSMVNTPFPSGSVSMTGIHAVGGKKRANQRRSKASKINIFKKALETPARQLGSDEQFVLFSLHGSPLTISSSDRKEDLWKRLMGQQL